MALSHSSATALNAQVCDVALLTRKARFVVVILTFPNLRGATEVCNGELLNCSRQLHLRKESGSTVFQRHLRCDGIDGGKSAEL